MPKKGGKKGKGKKGGAVGGGAAKRVADAQTTVSPGHDVGNQALQGEGERGIATRSTEIGDAPTAAATAPTTTPVETTQKPSAAPPQPTEDMTKETVAKPETQPYDTTRGSMQDVAERLQSARSGQLGTLKAGSPTEPSLISTDSAMRESKLEPVTSVGSEELEANEVSTPAAEGDLTAAAAASETLAGRDATLPERPRRKSLTDLEPAVAEPETADTVLTSHAKRPHETGIFTREDSTKPHKMPKTDENEQESIQKESKLEAAPSTAESAGTSTVNTTTSASGEDTVTSPSNKAEATGKEPKPPRTERFTAMQQITTTAGSIPSMKHTEAAFSETTTPSMKHSEAPLPKTPADVLPLDTSSMAASEQPTPTVTEMISTYPEGGAATAAAITTGASSRPAAQSTSTQQEQLQRAEDRVRTHDQAMQQMAADKETAEVPTRPAAAKLAPRQEAAQEEVAAVTAVGTQPATTTQKTTAASGLLAKQEQDKAAALKAQQEKEKEERKKTGFFDWIRRKIRGEKK